MPQVNQIQSNTVRPDFGIASMNQVYDQRNKEREKAIRMKLAMQNALREKGLMGKVDATTDGTGVDYASYQGDQAGGDKFKNSDAIDAEMLNTKYSDDGQKFGDNSTTMTVLDNTEADKAIVAAQALRKEQRELSENSTISKGIADLGEVIPITGSGEGVGAYREDPAKQPDATATPPSTQSTTQPPSLIASGGLAKPAETLPGTNIPSISGNSMNVGKEALNGALRSAFATPPVTDPNKAVPATTQQEKQAPAKTVNRATEKNSIGGGYRMKGSGAKFDMDVEQLTKKTEVKNHGSTDTIKRDVDGLRGLVSMENVFNSTFGTANTTYKDMYKEKIDGIERADKARNASGVFETIAGGKVSMKSDYTPPELEEKVRESNSYSVVNTTHINGDKNNKPTAVTIAGQQPGTVQTLYHDNSGKLTQKGTATMSLANISKGTETDPYYKATDDGWLKINKEWDKDSVGYFFKDNYKTALANRKITFVYDNGEIVFNKSGVEIARLRKEPSMVRGKDGVNKETDRLTFGFEEGVDMSDVNLLSGQSFK